jgi:hypothetical protein
VPAQGWQEPAECGERIEPTEPLVRWPYVQRVGQTEAVIAFGTTPDAGSARVVWGYQDYWDHQAAATLRDLQDVVDVDGSLKPLRLFHATLTDLEPGSEICYRVEIDGQIVSRGQSFWTAPIGEDVSVAFLAIGDFGAGTEEQLRVRDAMLPYVDRAQFILSLGDNAYGSGRPHEWQEFVFEVYQELFTELAFYPTWGNHDYSTADAAPGIDSVFLFENAWRIQDRERYWSMDWGPIHLVGLDTERPATEIRESETDDQLDWLEADLADNGLPWTIAAWHKPAWSGMPGRGPDPTALLLFAPVLEDAGAAMVLQGHNHMYERFAPMRGYESVAEGDEGTVYIVSGGGGRSLYGIGQVDYQLVAQEVYHFLFVEADACALTLTAIDLDGVIIDTATQRICG